MKKYFIWADKNCNGENVEWIELSGSAFYDFVNGPESEGRFIVHYKDIYNR